MSDFTQPYTPEGKHPEDAIYEVKEFVKKLQDVQEDYFQRLSKGLKLTEEGEEYLFDYIYNTNNEVDEIDDFAHYVQTLGKSYRNFIKK
jgi:hypothetical protein